MRQRQAKATHLVLVSAAGSGYGLSRALSIKDDGCWGARPRCCPTRRATGSPPTAVTPDHGPAPALRGPHPGLGPGPRRCSAPRPESGAGRYPPGSEGGQAAAASVCAAPRHPLSGADHLAACPPALAQRRGVSHTGAADRLSGIRPDRHRTDGTAGRLARARHEQGKTWR